MDETGTRRLCAIMFADIVGYTALMERDEAEAGSSRSRFRRIIESRVPDAHGEVVQFYGDGALSIFSSAVEASRCAVAVQQAFNEDPHLPVRIGIHVGDVVRDREGVWGDGVNVAARIEALAVPGSVFLSEKIVEELKNHPRFDVAPMGAFTLKNVMDPVEVFALVHPGITVPDPSDVQTPERTTADDGALAGPDTKGWKGIAAVAAVVAVLASGGAWSLFQSFQERRARDVTIPQIETLIAQGRYDTAVSLAEEAERYLRADELAGLWPRMARPVALTVTPANAHVAMSRVERPSTASEARVTLAEEWVDLGSAPIEIERLPLGIYRVQIAAAGFDTLRVIYPHVFDESGEPLQFDLRLPPSGSIPAGQSVIGPKNLTLDLLGLPPNYDPVPGADDDLPYLLDRYEVTNRQYKEFVDAGGYQAREYWSVDFVADGQTLPWEQAMALFRDRSGRPGPSTWEGGAYPEGQDDHPVGGVSWYEAAAYAEFAGASLPTVFHWMGALENRGFDMAGFGNFRGEGPAPVGAAPFGPFGIHDLAGNVREWVWNRTGPTRYILGGGWNDPLYSYTQGAYAPPLDRSAKNGLRLAYYPGASESDLSPFRAPIERELPDFAWGSDPVSDELFEVLAGRYDYDPGRLDATIDSVDESSVYWRKERVSFNATYADERMFGYLFLPKNVEPPYQVLVYFPGAGSMIAASSERLNAADMIDYIVKTGRAVLHPIYKDTYERFVGLGQNRGPNRDYVDRKVRWIQDVRRSIDYLETRDDIDLETIAYWGLSWGAEHAPIALATEPRLKAGVLMDGGAIHVPVLREADESSFAPRVSVPVLMLNGRYDYIFPVETTQRPFFELLGTPAANKEHLLYDSGHVVVNRHWEEVMDAMADWLDRHFGRVP